jgi:hypothetical protein
MPPKAPSLREQVTAQRLRAGGTCPICLWLDEHPADADEMRDILADPLVLHSELHRWFRAQGIVVGRQAVPNHRQGACGGLPDGRRL